MQKHVMVDCDFSKLWLLFLLAVILRTLAWKKFLELWRQKKSLVLLLPCSWFGNYSANFIYLCSFFSFFLWEVGGAVLPVTLLIVFLTKWQMWMKIVLMRVIQDQGQYLLCTVSCSNCQSSIGVSGLCLLFSLIKPFTTNPKKIFLPLTKAIYIFSFLLWVILDGIILFTIRILSCRLICFCVKFFWNLIFFLHSPWVHRLCHFLLNFPTGHVLEIEIYGNETTF